MVDLVLPSGGGRMKELVSGRAIAPDTRVIPVAPGKVAVVYNEP